MIRYSIFPIQKVLIFLWFWDTVGDLETLVSCYDLNPEENSDELGDSTDDCDFEGNRFIKKTPPSTKKWILLQLSLKLD